MWQPSIKEEYVDAKPIEGPGGEQVQDQGAEQNVEEMQVEEEQESEHRHHKHLTQEMKQSVLELYNGLLERMDSKQAAIAETARLTKKSPSTVYRLLADGPRPKKKRSDTGTYRKFGSENFPVVREIIYKMWNENNNPTLRKIQDALKEQSFSCGRETLRKLILKNGFKFITIDKKSTILESTLSSRLITWNNAYLENTSV